MVDITITTNNIWSKRSNPLVTVITSTFNRKELLKRAMLSVNNQTFKDIEYIVVDNGSTDNIDDVILPIMDSATIPMMYIKRSEGIGPHTGKNSAIKEARGYFLIMLDSDDELLPVAVETLVKAWETIPKQQRSQYREVVAQCIDEYGNRVGIQFPEKINRCTPKEAFKIWQQPGMAAEHISMNVTKYLKEMPFPEPDGISWVVDSVVLWNRLSKIYKSYFINDTLKVYYIGSPDSISNQDIKNITPKHLRNMLWAHKFELNHWDEYEYTFKNRIDRTLKVSLYSNVLQSMNELSGYKWAKEPVNGFLNKFLIALWSIPVNLGGASFFKKTKM